MSLDVWLENKPCDKCGRCDDGFSANITHNLGEMAQEAGIYMQVWRPDECGIETAGELIPHLEHGIAFMKANPEHCKKFNAENEWGLYEHFLPWLEEYLEACKKNPDATVRVDR